MSLFRFVLVVNAGCSECIVILIISYGAFRSRLGPINHSRTRLAATNAWMAFLYGLGPELVKVGDIDSDGLTGCNVELNLMTD